MRVLVVGPGHVTRVSLSGCGRWVGVARMGPAGRMSVDLWDWTRRRVVFTAGDRRCRDAFVHPSGATFIGWGSVTPGMRVWPTTAGRFDPVTVSNEWVQAVAGSADGNRLVGVVADSLVGWTATEGIPREDWRVPLGAGRGWLAVSPDGGLVAVERGDGFHFWRGRAELRFAADGALFATAEPGGGFGLNGLLNDGAALFPDESGRLLRQDFDRLWPEPPLLNDEFGGPVQDDPDRFRGAAVSRCGEWVLVARGDRVELLTADTLAVRRKYTFSTVGKPTCVAFAPDGLTAACGTSKGEVVIWDVD